MTTSLDNIQELIREATRPLTTIEASKYLGVSISTLYKYTHTKAIPFFKPTGRKNYFLKDDLDNFLLKGRSSTNIELEQIATLKLNRSS
jgi:excisionase family DNA binding protein